MHRRHLFIHIPKTGGTTMGQILRRNFGAGFYSYYGLWDTRQFSEEDVAGMLDLHPQFRCIASHMFSTRLPFESPTWEVRAFAFIRKPFDRALSLYFHNVRMNRENGGSGYAQQIEPFFEKVLRERVDSGFFDFQTRFLTAQEPTASGVQKILDLVRSGNLILAPLERFIDACLVLENVFPDDLRNTAFTKSHMQSPREQAIPPKLEERLLDCNPHDQQLYEVACSLFEKKTNALFSGPEGLETAKRDFARRVDILKKQERNEQLRNQMTSWFGNLVGKVLK